MSSVRKIAIIVGVLFIVGDIAGVLSLSFLGVLDEPDYLAKLAGNETQVLIGALLESIMAFACAAIAIWLYPVLKKHDEALALGAVGFRIIEAVLFLIAVAGLLSLLTVSQEHVKAGALDASHFQALGSLLLAIRDWASEVLGAIAFSLGALIYYWVFYQSKLIPRWLSGWGLIAIMLHLASALLVMFNVITPWSTVHVILNLPLLQELALAIWLIVKGFNRSTIAPGPANQM